MAPVWNVRDRRITDARSLTSVGLKYNDVFRVIILGMHVGLRSLLILALPYVISKFSLSDDVSSDCKNIQDGRQRKSNHINWFHFTVCLPRSSVVP